MNYFCNTFRRPPRAVCAGTHIAAIAVVFSAFLGTGTSVFAQRIDVLLPRRAQGMTVLRIEVADLSIKSSILVEIKGPVDDDYRTIDLMNHEPVVREDRFSRTPEGGGVVVIPVFLTGTKNIETARHPFGIPGRYQFRLRSRETPEVGSPPRDIVLFETEMEFAGPSAADEEFLTLARDPRVAGLVGLQDLDATVSERRTLPGLALVAHIVESTRHKGDPTHGRSEWAAPLYELAFAVPDSSYAPYVAYYAACSYMWQWKNVFVKREYGYDLPDERVAQLEHYKKAHKALEFAMERGNSYIKPFATLFLAALKAWAADYAGARTLIESLDAGAHASSQVARMAAEVDHFVLSKERESDE